MKLLLYIIIHKNKKLIYIMLILDINNHNLLSLNKIEIFNIKKPIQKEVYRCHTRFFKK